MQVFSWGPILASFGPKNMTWTHTKYFCGNNGPNFQKNKNKIRIFLQQVPVGSQTIGGF
jgi:hypothetical protein